MLSISKSLEEQNIFRCESYLWCSNVTWEPEVSVYEFAGSNLGHYRPSVIRLDDVHFRPDLHCFEKLLFQLASVRTPQQPVRTPLSDWSALDSFRVQFKGRLLQLSGQCGFPSGRAHKWGKNHNSNIIVRTSVSIGLVARSTVKEIADSTSTVWTTAYHGPDERIVDMEIACWRLAVRTFIPCGPDPWSLIWKLLAVDVRPSERQCLVCVWRLFPKGMNLTDMTKSN
jgi:hypothetical protein